MDELRPDRVEIVEIEALQQRELLQQDRPLAPRAALDDRIAAIVVGQRRLDRGLPARHVVGGQHAAMAAARGVEDFLRAAEAVDRLGDKARDTRRRGRARCGRSRSPAAGIGLGQHAAVGRGQRRVAEQLAGGRRIAARQIDGGGGRPFAAEQLGDRHDRVADAADQRVAVLGITERRLDQLGERHRAVIARQPRPGVERARHGRGQQPGAGDQIEAEAPVMRDRRALRRHALAADHLGSAGSSRCRRGSAPRRAARSGAARRPAG